MAFAWRPSPNMSSDMLCAKRHKIQPCRVGFWQKWTPRGPFLTKKPYWVFWQKLTKTMVFVSFWSKTEPAGSVFGTRNPGFGFQLGYPNWGTPIAKIGGLGTPKFGSFFGSKFGPKICEKPPKFGGFFDNFNLWAAAIAAAHQNISGWDLEFSSKIWWFLMIWVRIQMIDFQKNRS